MSSSGYTAWAVTAGEVPTTAYWNILGANDASFNTGNGFNDAVLQTRHFASNTVKSTFLALSNALDGVNGVQTYTPTLTSTSGGSWTSPVGYYINLGGIKLCWGTVAVASNATTGHCSCSTPSSFFTTVQIGIPAIMSEGNNAFQVASGDTFNTATIPFYISNTNNVGSAVVSWLVIGT